MNRERRDPLTKPKTAMELRNLRKAIDVTMKVFDGMNKPFGRSEAAVAAEIRTRGRELGASLAFRPIVASGINSGYVHHKPGRKIVRADEPVIFDIGFRVGGQCSDVTRMHIPDRKKYKRFYKDTVEMQHHCIDAAKPGRTLKDVQTTWKKLMRKKGHVVRHCIGHGVGNHVHERIKGPLRPGMVITVEPGIYEKKKGGCRVEDMVLITRNKPRVLTKSIRFSRPCA